MLSKVRILSLFERLNNALEDGGERGEVGIVGGAVMCLVYNAREATRDIDAIFEPSQVIRKLVAEIAREEALPEDWLNDAAKGYLKPGFTKESVLELSHLTVWAPEPKYMLAMKCLSARWDTSDRDDVLFLLKLLKIKDPESVFALLEDYYPRGVIQPKTKFFIEEALETINPPRRRK